jgi:hypothetical protein
MEKTNINDEEWLDRDTWRRKVLGLQVEEIYVY